MPASGTMSGWSSIPRDCSSSISKRVLRCRRLTGGAYDNGYFVEPTIFGGVVPGMRIAQEEVFGPVLALMAADDFDQAMSLANGVKFGHTCSIYTGDANGSRRD